MLFDTSSLCIICLYHYIYMTTKSFIFWKARQIHPTTCYFKTLFGVKVLRWFFLCIDLTLAHLHLNQVSNFAKMEKKSFNFLAQLSAWYDVFFKESNVSKVERIIINFALVGFLGHLLLIFLAKHFDFHFDFFSHLTPNYLKAIYTPFSIILFYEVLTLVLILPRSISIFIGKQYEIITLIAIRSFFHDIAEYDLDKSNIYTFDFLKEISLDLVGALLLFFLTILYYTLFNQTQKISRDASLKRTRFINIKKATSLILCALLLVLSVISFTHWAGQSYNSIVENTHLPNANGVFYKDFFSVMIFVDVFLLILSFIYSSTYDIIFRNAGFVISTILIRIALTADKPFNIYFSLTAVLFGVFLIGLFVLFNSKLSAKKGGNSKEEWVLKTFKMTQSWANLRCTNACFYSLRNPLVWRIETTTQSE